MVGGGLRVRWVFQRPFQVIIVSINHVFHVDFLFIFRILLRYIPWHTTLQVVYFLCSWEPSLPAEWFWWGHYHSWFCFSLLSWARHFYSQSSFSFLSRAISPPNLLTNKAVQTMLYWTFCLQRSYMSWWSTGVYELWDSFPISDHMWRLGKSIRLSVHHFMSISFIHEVLTIYSTEQQLLFGRITSHMIKKKTTLPKVPSSESKSEMVMKHF